MQERFTERPYPPLASQAENGAVVGLTSERASPGHKHLIVHLSCICCVLYIPFIVPRCNTGSKRAVRWCSSPSPLASHIRS